MELARVTRSCIQRAPSFVTALLLLLLAVHLLDLAVTAESTRTIGVSDGAATGAAERLGLRTDFGQLPISFEPNVGQANGEARFVARVKGSVIRLASSKETFA